MAEEPRRRKTEAGKGGRRAFGLFLSTAAHVGVLLAIILLVRPQLDPIPPAPDMPVSLVGEQLQPDVAQTPTPTPQHTRAAAPVSAPTPTPQAAASRPKVSPLAQTSSPEPPGESMAPGNAPTLGGADLAGAASADAGAAGSGGQCDMARRVQAALRKDHLVLSAVAGAHTAPGEAGRPLLVWNGDWVQSSGEDGKGLSAVREAIMWEVGFSPAACKVQAMHGYVVFSLSGGSRVAVGASSWRWSDLLRTPGVRLE